MKLAQFDLDHTLMPFDSGMAWTRCLVDAQALPPQAEARYPDSCHLPLLRTVSNRVAVHADERLRAHAPACGWPILEPR